MAMVDTHQTINGCRIWFEHSDEKKAKIEAGNYKSYLATVDMKQSFGGLYIENLNKLRLAGAK